MEPELSRYDWSRLQTVRWDGTRLLNALQGLWAARDRETAEAAADEVTDCTFATGLLCEASVATAAALVRMLWGCPDDIVDLPLLLLADVADGTVDPADPAVYGPVRVPDCLDEVRVGYLAYAALLEQSDNTLARATCIHLLTACGLSDPRLRDRALHLLRCVLEQGSMPDHETLLRNRIEELAS